LIKKKSTQKSKKNIHQEMKVIFQKKKGTEKEIKIINKIIQKI
jgi:uncharacterized protein (UPF0335 family)